VHACGASESRILRDAAKLVEELQDGRRVLGTIRNIRKVKADFLALDIDPNRREQRERERERDGARSQGRSQRLRVAAARAIDAGVSLEELAWEKIDDASAHDEVLRAMRARPEMKTTLTIVDYIDNDGHAHDNLILEHEREEALLALEALGDRAIVPLLVGRARRGDRKAVEMLAALKDPRAVPHLLALLDGRADRYHHFDTAVVHALRTHGARGAVPKLLAILARNPLVDWRTGIERGDLVQEVVLALGALGDRGAASALLKVLAATNKEYDEVHPLAAGALGALGVREALGPLAGRLEQGPGVSAEEIWAFGEIAARDEPGREAALVRMNGLSGGLDPAAEVVRVGAIAKLGGAREPAAFAIQQALSTPGHRKVDTSRQRTWAWRCLGEIGGSLDRETIRHFVTLDDHGVRAAATRALARRDIPVPVARPYFLFALDELEVEGGLRALHDAVRNPWGVFRYNVALRLARIGDKASVPVLCEVLRALYLEGPTSTYEYDDPPYHLRWFARALGTFDEPAAAECLIEGLASANHHVRQIVASDPPKDDRVVPALVRLLDDPRPLLRSRAQHALESFKKTLAYARAMEERDQIAEA
jgi:HEAT repeat protein